MHRVTSRTYLGQPVEQATLSTQTGSGGQISVTLDGRAIPPNGPFLLPAAAGQPSVLQVSLAGPNGAFCVVGLTVVDGSSDGDFLQCQPHNPAPSNIYTFSVAPQPALNAFVAVKRFAVAAPQPKRPKGPKAAKGAKAAKAPKKRKREGRS